MKIEVRVKAGARETAVEKQTNGTLVVKVKEPAKEGRANQAVIEAIAEYFSVPRRSVAIVRGHASRSKLVEIGSASVNE